MNKNITATAKYSPDTKLIYGSLFAFIVLIHWLINQFQVPNMDEIWNYQFARRILYGQVPYRDFLMLHTPFSAQINAPILNMWGDKLIVMRWSAAIIAGLNGVVALRILKLIGKGWILSYIYSILFIFPMLLNPQNNYSWYAVLFLSLALLVEVFRLTRGDSRKRICDFLIGVSLGAVTITKQNIGMAGLMAAIMFCFYIYYTREKKIGDSKRELSTSLLSRITGWGTIIVPELLWMQSYGSFSAAVQIYGNISNFASYGFKHLVYWLQSSYVVLLFSIVLAIILIAFTKAFDGRNSLLDKRILILLALYSSANFAMVYPIPDPAHIWFGMPLSIIALAVLWDHPTLEGTYRRGMHLGLLVVLLVLLFMPLQGLQKYNHYDLKHYESIPLSKALYENTVSINDYILSQQNMGQNVFFLNYQAPRFLIPLDQFNYRCDTLLTCDLGPKGVSDIIEVLSSTNNATVLIAGSSSERHRRFESQAIQDYVRSNMRYAGYLYGFDVYTR